MRKFPKVANRPALRVCLCVPEAGFVCRECQAGTVAVKAQSIEEADALGDECPWNPDELPDRLRGYGYRGADQDGFDGSEWVTPQEDLEEQMIEAVKVSFDAREIS